MSGLRRLIYTPSGRAGEYADHGYAANLYQGCTHGCKYCYVPGIFRLAREEFHSGVQPAPMVLERLKADMERLGKLPEPVFLCFTCDPYAGKGPFTSACNITREAIDIIAFYGNRVNILTKGGTRAIKDFGALQRSGSMIGATLTFWADEKSKDWELNAALPGERIYMLECAKDSGIETWASIEPVIDPEESLEVMRQAMHCVDTFKVGKWNHDSRAGEIDWKRFARDAVALLEGHGKKYLFKKDLREAINQER